MRKPNEPQTQAMLEAMHTGRIARNRRFSEHKTTTQSVNACVRAGWLAYQGSPAYVAQLTRQGAEALAALGHIVDYHLDSAEHFAYLEDEVRTTPELRRVAITVFR